MQISVDSTGPLERRLTVTVPENSIASEVQDRLKKLARSTRIAGFRPGRAPLRVVERRFGDRVRQEVVGEVLQRTFNEAMRQENLRPAGQPSIEPLTVEPGRGLSYTATFEVFPEFDLDWIGDLEVEVPVCTITDADVDRMVDTLRRQHRRWIEVERGAEPGDRLLVNFVGRVEGTELEGGRREDATIELGAGQLAEGFEQGLAGARAGETRPVQVRFPDDHPREDLRGKTATFEVKVKKVERGELPALDEELFAAFGVKEGGLEAFRAEVRRNMEREKERVLLQRRKNNVLRALYEGHRFEVPKTLVAQEAQRLYQALQQRLAMQGASAEDLQEHAIPPEMAEGEARRRVAVGLAVGEVIRANRLAADPVKVRARVEALASAYEDPAAVVRYYYEQRERLAEIEAAVLEDEAVAWIVARAKTRERPLTFDALMNPGQTGSDAQGEAGDDR